ncbi:hypothetical protein E2C01_080358 [Portunus trituberculatus]|uniref:Uncharacterized protein n=1 Tax=Portunus trituberculatus TaxID=210409 RepID=A0A5B7IY73_PORTR|nr:hypothetical protein [Portunus trituberculatus]
MVSESAGRQAGGGWEKYRGNAPETKANGPWRLRGLLQKGTGISAITPETRRMRIHDIGAIRGEDQLDLLARDGHQARHGPRGERESVLLWQRKCYLKKR